MAAILAEYDSRRDAGLIRPDAAQRAIPVFRHPGEGRGPALGIDGVESWIPAFAGMTAFGGGL